MAKLIEGAEAMERLLRELPNKMSKKIVRQGVRAGQKPILVRAKENARSNVGGRLGALIARRMKIKIPKRQKPGQYLLSVQVTNDPEFIHITKDGTRHWIPVNVEYGHGPDKDQVARPYLRPAGDSEQEKAIKITSAKIAEGIEREAKLIR